MIERYTMLAIKDAEGGGVMLDASIERPEAISMLSRALIARRDAFLRLRHYARDSVVQLTTANPKIVEWRARSQIESSKEWIRRRMDLENAEHDVEILRAILNITVHEVRF